MASLLKKVWTLNITARAVTGARWGALSPGSLAIGEAAACFMRTITHNTTPPRGKRVETLREIAPNISRVALLMNPTNPNVKVEQTDAEAGAKKLGLETVTLNATNAREIDAAFEQLLSAKANALVTATDPILLDRREQIVSFAHRHRLPAVYFVRQFAAVGGLLRYGPSISWMYLQAGEYMGQILKGSNPAEMPALQPTQFELVINLKTAHALGLAVPQTLLVAADEVIE
jgi:putative ABC transport system substrate-binding protein